MKVDASPPRQPAGNAGVRNRLTLGSKAETLCRARSLVRTASILPVMYFSVDEWRRCRADVLDRLQREHWASGPVIVRSSTAHEDDPATLMPGAYLSIANVRGRDAIAEAIEAVIHSYHRPDAMIEQDGQNQVLIQPLLVGASLTGVLFTRDPNTGSPYLVVNYEEDGDAGAVTGGAAAQLRTFYAWRPHSRVLLEGRMAQLSVLADELEELTGIEGLDVEFAFSQSDTLFLLQVRPMVGTCTREYEAQQESLKAIANKVRLSNERHPYLLGSRSVFGVMPDWNPAEIIGVRPRPLALSLYRRLITDTEWAQQRAQYGYRDVTGFPLLVDFFGLPYVDVRVSCNSLIPAALDEPLAERLVTHYINRLIDHPELHDKVEFDIFFTTYSFTLDDRLARQVGEDFSVAERRRIVTALRALTERLVRDDDGVRLGDRQRLRSLRDRFRVVRWSGLDWVDQVYWLLNDCRRFGTRAFAGYARLGFIATELLRSLEARGTVSTGDVARFMASLDTPTNRMLRDRAGMSKHDFLAEYGFLRPGTYDIRSPRYDEAPDGYFDWSAKDDHGVAEEAPAWSPPTVEAINRLLYEHGLGIEASTLLAFIQESIEGRENAKFEFTRHLSEVLSLIRRLGHEHGLTADDLSFVTVEVFDELYRGCGDPASRLRSAIERGRTQYTLTSRIVLPPLIVEPRDVFSFEVPPTEPNFITQGSVTAPTVDVEAGSSQSLAGKILLLPSGDPGFDWIFSRGIAGFVTRYGGANSHMAIRAHQLGLPAVVGAGEELFNRCRAAKALAVDCLNRRVQVLL